MNIAIIGDGCSAALLLLNLLPTLKSTAISIRVFSDSSSIGRGLAYSTDNDKHLLNVSVGSLSAYPQVPDHFLQYCCRYFPDTTASSFVARNIYGDYLAHCLSEALVAVDSSRFAVVPARVIDLQHNGYFQLHTAAGRSYDADCVVLALGHFAKDSSYQHLISDEAVRIANSWSREDLAVCDSAKDILLIGSGHTAIDAILSLHQRNPPPRITCISRRGLLAQAHRIQAPTLIADQATVLLQATQPTARQYCQQLRQAIVAYQASGKDWRDIVGGLRSQTPALWQRLPAIEQRRFMRHVWPYWDCHRHRLAPAVAAEITALIEQQQLAIVAGRIKQITLAGERIRVHYLPRAANTISTLDVDRIIDCTGPNYQLAAINDPLIQSLLVQQLIEQDALGMGLKTQANYRLQTNTTEHLPLYYLGPMLRAKYLEAVGVAELRQHAATLAEHLLACAQASASELLADATC